jgi:hypothetical protein
VAYVEKRAMVVVEKWSQVSAMLSMQMRCKTEVRAFDHVQNCETQEKKQDQACKSAFHEQGRPRSMLLPPYQVVPAFPCSTECSGGHSDQKGISAMHSMNDNIGNLRV